MLQNNSGFSSFSVHDTPTALYFYRNILMLPVKEQDYGFELQVSGAGSIFVYPKSDHEPATFTILNFQVTDIRAAVKALKVKEVVFESYDLPEIKTDDDHICTMPEMNMKQAWFKDPSGNILSLLEQG